MVSVDQLTTTLLMPVLEASVVQSLVQSHFTLALVAKLCPLLAVESPTRVISTLSPALDLFGVRLPTAIVGVGLLIVKQDAGLQVALAPSPRVLVTTTFQSLAPKAPPMSLQVTLEIEPATMVEEVVSQLMVVPLLVSCTVAPA